MKLYSRGQARRSVFLTVGFRGLSQIATLASYIVLVRALSEESFGILNLLYAVIPVISTIASLGIEQTLSRFQPEYLQRGENGIAAWLLRVSASSRFVSNLLVIGLLLLTWKWLAPVFGLEAYRTEFALFSLLIMLHYQAMILRVSLSSHMLQGYAIGLMVVLAITKLIAYLMLVHVGRLTLTTAILADTAGYALMYAAMRIVHARRCAVERSVGSQRPDAGERRRLLRYAMFNNFNDTGTLLLTSKTDNFFIAALLNSVAVGAYAFYTRLNEMVSQLLPTRQLSNVIQPLFFSVPVGEATERVPRYFTLLLNTTLALQLPITIYAAAYHAEIVTVIFGAKFLDVSWLLPVIVGFATLNRIAEPVTLVAQYQEKASIILLSKLFGLYNAAAILVLIPIAGLYGVAVATGTAQLMKNLFIWWHVRTIARWTNFLSVAASNLIIGGGAIAICYVLKSTMNAPAIVDLACGAVVCTLATLLYLRTPAISESDRQILSSVFRGREIRILAWLGVVRRPAAEAS